MRVALGTFISIEACAASAPAALAAIEAAFSAVLEVEERMHPERPGSDVARINGAVPGAKTPIDASTLEVLRLAKRLNTLTRGVFDPCLPLCKGRLTDLELGGSGTRAGWVVCRVPVALDLGGIAKGYAIDCAIGALRAEGCSAGAVNAGGDLRFFGLGERALLLRLGDGACRPLTLKDTALAVSDLDEPRRPPGHRGYYSRARGKAHPVQRRFAAVAAPTAVGADALTKCLLLANPQTAARALRELGGRDLAGEAG